jgi:ketosteroid isomerase-like protein
MLDAEFVHVYRVRGGKIVGMRQYTDTAQFARVTETESDPTHGIG